MMNKIWYCPHCGGNLDSAGRCACGHGQPVTVTFVPPTTYIPTGWKCPQCGRIHAPHVSTCPFCAPFCQPYQVNPQPPNAWESDGTAKPNTWEPGTYTSPNNWDFSSISVGDLNPKTTISSNNEELHAADLGFDVDGVRLS